MRKGKQTKNPQGRIYALAIADKKSGKGRNLFTEGHMRKGPASNFTSAGA